MITFAINIGNLHPTSLCNEQWFWWLGFLLYHCLLLLCFRGAFACLCALYPNNLAARTAFEANSRFVPAIQPSYWPPEVK